MASPMSASSSQPTDEIDEPFHAIMQAAVEAATEDPDFEGELAKNQRRVIKSKLLDPITL